MEKEELKILYDTESRSKSNTKRLDSLELITKAFYDVASDVKVMAEQLTNMKEDISDIKIKVDGKTEENNKIAFNLKSAIINGIVMIIIGAIMALIIK